jgi:hypothetical protein
VCSDFKERRIVPIHSAICRKSCCPGWSHLESWLAETLADRESWREVSCKEDKRRFTGNFRIGTFTVPGGLECRFVRPVNTGRSDSLNAGGLIGSGTSAQESAPRDMCEDD